MSILTSCPGLEANNPAVSGKKQQLFVGYPYSCYLFNNLRSQDKQDVSVLGLTD
jgi:hypothetical protein